MLKKVSRQHSEGIPSLRNKAKVMNRSEAQLGRNLMSPLSGPHVDEVGGSANCVYELLSCLVSPLTLNACRTATSAVRQRALTEWEPYLFKGVFHSEEPNLEDSKDRLTTKKLYKCYAT